MAQQLPTDRQQPYSVSSQRNAGEQNFANILDLEAQRGKPIGTRNTGDSENQLKFIPAPLMIILSSTYCLIILCVILVIPILELAIGASYINQCTINSNIPVYLIVTGVCGIASILLTLAIVGAVFCLIKQNSTAGSVVLGCGIGVIFLIIALMSLFLFIWFIVGNVWIFGAKSNVVYDDITSPYYCHRTLYQFAFTILILTYVMTVISCILSCFRSCAQFAKAAK